MSNNRLYIHNQEEGTKVLLAKYYPSTGWCLRSDKINDLDKVITGGDGSLWGGEPFKLEYEIEKDEDSNLPVEDKYHPLVTALKVLVKLKEHKDKNGKDAIYLKAQPFAWENARTVLRDVLGDEYDNWSLLTPLESK